MKRFLLTFAFILSFLSAQAADISGIVSAFKGGNASALASAVDQEVDMAIPGTTKVCNGNESVSLLTTFFTGNKPTGFTVLHHADKKDNGFFVGKLSSGSTEFRVNITYRAEGDKAIIQSIRIE